MMLIPLDYTSVIQSYNNLRNENNHLRLVVTLISNLNLAWKFEFPIDSQLFWFLWNETFVIQNNITFQFDNVICYSILWNLAGYSSEFCRQHKHFVPVS